jgi:hypothetical protein
LRGDEGPFDRQPAEAGLRREDANLGRPPYFVNRCLCPEQTDPDRDFVVPARS